MVTVSEQDETVVLITGASSGFGLLTSLALAEAGYVVVASMRDLSKKEPLIHTARDKGIDSRIECTEMDVTKEEDMDSAISSVVDRFGSVDVLINNAGYAAGGFTEELTMEEWRRQFETNFFGLVAVTKAVLPYMRKQQSGKIINMSSISGRMALPGLGPYSASKFAVEGFSESLRLEMLPYGVQVVLVEPGSYKTNIWSKGMKDFQVNPESPYREKTDKMLKIVRHIEKTAEDPEDVARIIVEIVQSEEPNFRYPVGKGVKSSLRFRSFLPWKWVERMITKRM
ncbi:MAG TPA: SDR family oxidoreductase [Bacillales bacterium]|nr:SDR family oxidoreductase [Bacillales bacterium]